jgi:hypothetical protein
MRLDPNGREWQPLPCPAAGTSLNGPASWSRGQTEATCPARRTVIDCGTPGRQSRRRRSRQRSHHRHLAHRWCSGDRSTRGRSTYVWTWVECHRDGAGPGLVRPEIATEAGAWSAPGQKGDHLGTRTRRWARPGAAGPAVASGWHDGLAHRDADRRRVTARMCVHGDRSTHAAGAGRIRRRHCGGTHRRPGRLNRLSRDRGPHAGSSCCERTNPLADDAAGLPRHTGREGTARTRGAASPPVGRRLVRAAHCADHLR